MENFSVKIKGNRINLYKKEFSFSFIFKGNIKEWAKLQYKSEDIPKRELKTNIVEDNERIEYYAIENYKFVFKYNDIYFCSDIANIVLNKEELNFMIDRILDEFSDTETTPIIKMDTLHIYDIHNHLFTFSERDILRLKEWNEKDRFLGDKININITEYIGKRSEKHYFIENKFSYWIVQLTRKDFRNLMQALKKDVEIIL